MRDPLISVVVTTYNQEKYIEETIESILKQDYDNFELVVTDDCSTDNTYKILKNIEKKDLRVKVFQTPFNLGPVKNSNFGLKKAQGEYISLLAGDDKFVVPNRLRLLIEPFKYNKDLKIIYSEGKAFYPDGRTYLINETLKVYKLLDKEPHEILKWLYTNVSPLFLQGALIKHEFLKKVDYFDESGLADDYVLNIKMFREIKSKKEFGYIKDITWLYRIHENNIHKNTERQKKLILGVIKKYTPFYLKPLAYFNIYSKYLPRECLIFPFNIIFLFLEKFKNLIKRTKKLKRGF